jgi:hypothetical protein
MDGQQAGASSPLPPIDGTQQRLDAILAELRAIRAQGAATPPPDGTVELREPAPHAAPSTRKRGG